MASNPYINAFNSVSAQTLAENLVVESLKFYGHDVWYLPRTGINRDKIFNENELSTFNQNCEIEVYVKNVNSFGGDGQFLSKFSLEVRDQIILTISVRSFNEFVVPVTERVRPMEGDLIFIPFLAAAYEIRFVENAAIFFQMGKIQSWDLTLEVFEYSNEIFDTGIPQIDDIYNKYNTDDLVEIEDVEPFAQNEDIQTTADPIMEDWNDENPFGDFK